MTAEDLFHDLDDDGATEVVSSQPRRRGSVVVDLETVAAKPAGGRMAAMRAIGAEHLSSFIIRRSPTGVVKIALPHARVFHAMWSAWAAKRAQGDPDPGVSAAEIAAAAGCKPAQIRTAVTSLVRNGAARSVHTHVGWAGSRASYYPTTDGVEAFALAEVVGAGCFVQVGATTKAWRGRNQDEPSNLFQHAALLRGGAAARVPDLTESA